MAIILGIDPGSRKLGYGVIQVTQQNKLCAIDYGVLEIPLNSIPERLGFIYQELDAVIKKFNPQLFSIEEVFVHKNVASALKLGQARGAAILAAINNKISVKEFSARAVKQAVVGKGSADKFQVQHMVKILFNLPEAPLADAADALAIALCAAHNNINHQVNRSNNIKYSRGRWR